MDLVSKIGPAKWSVIAAELPGRIGKQARERQATDTSLYMHIHLRGCKHDEDIMQRHHVSMDSQIRKQ